METENGSESHDDALLSHLPINWYKMQRMLLNLLPFEKNYVSLI